MKSRIARLKALVSASEASSLAAVLAFLTACGGSTVVAPGDADFPQLVVDQLRSQGMEVSVGYPRMYTQAESVYTYPVFHSCYGNNPASPYVLPVVKSWPEEYVDPAMKDGFVKTLPGYSATYRLDPTEAVILFGRMPPAARYMGLQSWLFTTGYLENGSPWNANAYDLFAARAGSLIQYLFATVPANPARVQSFSSVDNNINNVVMQNQSGAPWDQIRYFVITPDQATDGAVRAALDRLRVDPGAIFTEGIPPRFAIDSASLELPGAVVGPLGLDAGAADFLTLLRYAMPEDEQAADLWREILPLTVLRVRPSTRRAAAPWADRIAEPRTAVDESYLADDLRALISGIEARALGEGLTLDTDEPMVDLLIDLGQFGPASREIGMNALGDNQDASYFLFKPKPLDTGKVYAVVGTLATETGNGTYVGLSVNDASLLKGVANISDPTLKGSAMGYSGIPNRDKFFVRYFARDCTDIASLTDGAGTSVTADMVPMAGDTVAPGDPTLHGFFSAAVRNYVARGSTRGPDSTRQLRPHVLTFSRQ